MEAALIPSLSNPPHGQVVQLDLPTDVAFDDAKAVPSTARRDRLVKEYFSFVRVIASRLLRSLGPSIDIDELVSYGYKGLLEAADRFDENRGVSFKTFAYYRIRGAMIDALRTHFWYSRTDYLRFRTQEQTHALMQHYADFEADRAQQTDSTTEEDRRTAALGDLVDILGQIAAIHVTSLEVAVQIADDRVYAADDVVEHGDERRRVRRAVATLPEKERRLVELYYFEDKTLEQAGAELGLSKSWTCRLHARAVRLMRDALEASE
jgi:RNA polymerase sigma factor for flagellar operon FliA